MNDFWLNIRIWRYHIQGCQGSWRLRLSYNDYFEKIRLLPWEKSVVPGRLFEIYDLKWPG